MLHLLSNGTFRKFFEKWSTANVSIICRKIFTEISLQMVSALAGCLVDMFQTQIHVLLVNLSLIPVSGLRRRTELVCAHGKRDPGIKFTGLEFCLPFAQTVN